MRSVEFSREERAVARGDLCVRRARTGESEAGGGERSEGSAPGVPQPDTVGHRDI